MPTTCYNPLWIGSATNWGRVRSQVLSLCYQSIPIDGGFLKWGTPSYPFIDGFFRYNPTILGIPRLWKSPDVFPVQMPFYSSGVSQSSLITRWWLPDGVTSQTPIFSPLSPFFLVKSPYSWNSQDSCCKNHVDLNTSHDKEISKTLTSPWSSQFPTISTQDGAPPAVMFVGL